MNTEKIVVLGGGAWGTALALTADRSARASDSNSQIFIWTPEEEIVSLIQKTRVNTPYLPDILIPERIQVMSDLALAMRGASFVILAIPTQHIRSFCMILKEYLSVEVPILCAAKGIEIAPPHELPYQIMQASFPNPCGVLSGPNFATEVARNLPAATTLASSSLERADFFAAPLRHSRFSCDLSLDPLGVSLAGALKNVVAIACGIVSGCEFGKNAHAVLLTRALEEMSRIGDFFQAQKETFLGLAGLGDLILTCSSLESRNYSFGFETAQKYIQGIPLKEILAQQTKTIEGMHTAQSLHFLRQKISLPIFEFVYRFLYQGADLYLELEKLLNKKPAA